MEDALLIITAPVKALCSQVFQDFQKTSPFHSVIDESLRAPPEKMLQYIDLARAEFFGIFCKEIQRSILRFMWGPYDVLGRSC